MKKIFILMLVIVAFSCTTDTEKPSQTDLKDSTELSYAQMKELLELSKNIVEKSSDSKSFKANFDKSSAINGLNQMIELIEGLEIQAELPHTKGGPIGISQFENGVKRMQKHIGLGILYKNDNIRGFEILKKDIDFLTKDSNYYSIRAYPLMHPNEEKNRLTYALITVRDGSKIQTTKGDVYQIGEEIGTLSDTWDPWPPLKRTIPSELKDSTLLKYYK